jgi:hypothetical protein
MKLKSRGMGIHGSPSEILGKCGGLGQPLLRDSQSRNRVEIVTERAFEDTKGERSKDQTNLVIETTVIETYFIRCIRANTSKREKCRWNG